MVTQLFVDILYEKLYFILGSGWRFINGISMKLKMMSINVFGVRHPRIEAEIGGAQRQQLDSELSPPEIGIGIHVALPKGAVSLQRHVINVKNIDNKCILYTIVLAKYYKILKKDGVKDFTNPIILKKYFKNLYFKDITFPVKRHDLQKLEIQNQLNFNVFLYVSPDRIDPYYITPTKVDNWTTVNCLIIRDKHHTHMCWIRDMDNLLKKG